ncbi:sensor histidine kinase [Legionella sp. W05-934-2]|jgi:two-component system sensor histidine kinase CpxA|uniref:sensor histidine kinase n=1 Tax=Legionella sp. W05-934-2 TaxID=1198649 RepID=UPI0034630036
MRSLYWKIFLSFWLATIVIILITTWVISIVTHKSSLHAHEQIFMDSYATAAVSTYETGNVSTLKKWLEKTGKQKGMHFYLLSSKQGVLGDDNPPESVKTIAKNLIDEELDEGLFKFHNLIISHELVATSGAIYRLAAITNKPIYPLSHLPWGSLVLRVLLGVFISGLICYLLSYYLTQPLRLLGQAAKSIGRGELSTRVGRFKGHSRDEIAQLSQDFDRMAEQIEAIMHSKERLLSDISHELRSPLARLQVAIELARKNSQNTTQLDRMEKECHRLNHLIGEILEYARLENSTEEHPYQAVDLTDLLTHLVDDAHFEAQHRQITIHFDYNQAVAVDADKRLLHRAIENILRNALRYSPDQGHIWLTQHLNHEDNTVTITVLDQGPGVPETELEKIADPFYRVDISREKKTGGYGLGLSIAMEAIRLHHGQLHFNNHPGKGLQVSIILPMTQR